MMFEEKDVVTVCWKLKETAVKNTMAYHKNQVNNQTRIQTKFFRLSNSVAMKLGIKLTQDLFHFLRSSISV